MPFDKAYLVCSCVCSHACVCLHTISVCNSQSKVLNMSTSNYQMFFTWHTHRQKHRHTYTEADRKSAVACPRKRIYAYIHKHTRIHQIIFFKWHLNSQSVIYNRSGVNVHVSSSPFISLPARPNFSAYLVLILLVVLIRVCHGTVCVQVNH